MTGTIRTDLSVCPYCGQDSLARVPGIEELVQASGLISEYANPGGRELLFNDKGRLQITDECFSCDAKKIRKFLVAE